MTTEEAFALIKRSCFGDYVRLEELFDFLEKRIKLNDTVLQDLQVTIESCKLPTIEHCVDYNSGYNDGLDRALEIIENFFGDKE